MRKNDQQYIDGFKDELNAFIGRVKERAQARIDKAMKEYEEVSHFDIKIRFKCCHFSFFFSFKNV